MLSKAQMLNKKREIGNFLFLIFCGKNQKGISIVVGYVLLITISIVMSILVYQWIKTYVPTTPLECSEGTSIFIRETDYDCINSKLNITLRNNGKFSINGIYARVSNIEGQELATIDISSKLISGGIISDNSIVFSEFVENELTPSEPTNQRLVSFNLDGIGRVYKIEIVPTRIQEIDDKKRSLSCNNAKTEEVLTCD